MSKGIRYATFPLDCDAKKAANQLIAQKIGSDRKLREDEYELRELWMDEYIRRGGKVKDKPQKRKPGQAIDTCKPPDPEEREEKETKVCGIENIRIGCEHGTHTARNVHMVDFKRPILEVVPGANFGYDKIELIAYVNDPCGEHPEWEIEGEGIKKGATQTMKAYSPGITKIWFPNQKPRKYYAIARACDGDAERVEIHAYDPSEWSIKFDISKKIDKIRGVAEVVEEVLDTVGGKFEWDWPNGDVSIKAQWKEHTDYRAFYAYSISINADPLIGANGELTLGPDKVTKLLKKIPKVGEWLGEKIEKVIKAKGFLRGNGKITCDIRYERSSPDFQKFVDNTGAGIKGSIGMSLGAEGSVGSGRWGFKAIIEATGTVVAKADTLLDEVGVGMKVGVDFDGLKGHVKAEGFAGWVDVEKTMVIIGARPIWGPEDFYFNKND